MGNDDGPRIKDPTQTVAAAGYLITCLAPVVGFLQRPYFDTLVLVPKEGDGRRLLDLLRKLQSLRARAEELSRHEQQDILHSCGELRTVVKSVVSSLCLIVLDPEHKVAASKCLELCSKFTNADDEFIAHLKRSWDLCCGRLQNLENIVSELLARLMKLLEAIDPRLGEFAREQL